MPSHLLIFYLKGFLMGFFCLDVHACLFTLFSIIVQKPQELNHPIVYKVLMKICIELGLIQKCKELIKGHHLLSCKDDPIEKVITKNIYTGSFPQQSSGILEFDIALFSFVDFIELLKQLLQIALVIILLHSFINIIIAPTYFMFFTLSERKHTFQRR